MKKLLTYSAVLVSSAVAGVLVWRKVEADKLENDLWAEAEKISEQQSKP
ncbi:DLW-39 family protein [Brachybacterium kimchii]|uniref:DLW-39 family protein n=1 Tax=Brachybacterium kimchii TaxID=2942909 RepID=A0ABY4N2D5_9MICO|nr:DLW-39 family protein [Brachybacterium kimchii]UQN28725.1 DLW-39 family protein [Brachybacterium kimchii]